jgi:cold-inducible RNA-binding protein
MNNSKLFVGNLSFTTTQNDLQDMFASHGTVTEASLINDRETGRSRGFGFVTMSTADEAQNAITALHGSDVDGRTLNITVAKPREERSGGSFGGGQRREFSGGRNRY